MPEDKKVVLVVEDERPILEAIVTKLNLEGFDPVSSTSVDQAINMLQDVKKVDAVWLDHYLPERLGTELVQFMKKPDSPYKNIPIFLVSNTASADRIYDYIHLGVEKYFVKADRRLDDIIADIKEFLKNGETK
jgi:PleD family two-component response regulator